MGVHYYLLYKFLIRMVELLQRKVLSEIEDLLFEHIDEYRGVHLAKYDGLEVRVAATIVVNVCPVKGIKVVSSHQLPEVSSRSNVKRSLSQAL